jgi:hypothetical protein
MPQCHWERLRRKRIRLAARVPLVVRRGQSGPVRSFNCPQLLDFVLPKLRLSASARHPKRARNHYSRRIASQRPRCIAYLRLVLAIARAMALRRSQSADRFVIRLQAHLLQTSSFSNVFTWCVILDFLRSSPRLRHYCSALSTEEGGVVARLPVNLTTMSRAERRIERCLRSVCASRRRRKADE